MVHGFRIVNPKNEALDIDLTNPEKSGLIVRRVEGLGPPQATINGQEIATSDGMIYSSARVGTRNIVFYFSMFARDVNSPYGELSIEQSRHLTYQYFPLKKEITIYTHTDTRIVYCKGYVESNEPDIFSDQEGCQISIICTDPYMYVEGDDHTVFSGIRGTFEFPFDVNILPRINDNLLDNADFRHLWNTTSKTVFQDSGYIFNGWEMENTKKSITATIDSGYISVTYGTNYTKGDKTLKQNFKNRLYVGSYPPPTDRQYTFSMVYESNADFVMNLVGPNGELYGIDVEKNASGNPVIFSKVIGDNTSIPGSDKYWTKTNLRPYRFSTQTSYETPNWDICGVSGPDLRVLVEDSSVRIYAMKLEYGTEQTLARVGQNKQIVYLIDEVDDSEMIEFGQIWIDTRAILDYKGTVDTGILITIHAFDVAEQIKIYNVDTEEQMIINTDIIQTMTGKPFGELDDIIISTVKGDRYCRLLREGVYTNIIGCLSRDSDWFQISQGNNGFAFGAEKGADNLSVTFSYQNAYVGI